MDHNLYSYFSVMPVTRTGPLYLQGWATLQLTRDPTYSRGFLSARSVTGFLSDVYPAAADEVGKIHLIADERVCFCKISVDSFLLDAFYSLKQVKYNKFISGSGSSF